MQAMSQMRALNQARNQKGFTIIELVVVILLLGILAATALPRFIDVTDQAHDAVFEATVGGFTTGVSMYRAQYFANGQPTSVTLDGQALTMNANGYPQVLGVGDSGYNSGNHEDYATACVNVFNSTLQSGRPTIAFDTDEFELGPIDSIITTNFNFTEEDQTADFRVFYEQGAAAIPDDPMTALVDESVDAKTAICYYVYTSQYIEHEDATAAGRTGLPVFTYRPSTGEITSFNSANAADQG